MKDRNTIVFLCVIGSLFVLFAITAPIAYLLIEMVLLFIGFMYIFFGLYLFVVTQFRGKSAFSFVKVQSVDKNIVQKPQFTPPFQPTPVKRTH